MGTKPRKSIPANRTLVTPEQRSLQRLPLILRRDYPRGHGGIPPSSRAKT